MAKEKVNNLQSPEEMAKAAQDAAMKAAMEQAQAMYGNIPGFQMSEIAKMQELLMEEVKSAVPSVTEAMSYQAEMMKEAGMDPAAMAKAYQQNMAYAQQMMQQAQMGFYPTDETTPQTTEEFEYFDDSSNWGIIIKGDRKLSAQQYRLLAFGAPISIYNGDFVDAIESTADSETLKEMLESWWEITDRESSLETISWLLNEGHHSKADKALAEILERGMENISAEEMQDEDAKMGDVYTIVELMLETECCTAANLPKTVMAWDLVRVVNVARWACLCNYINEEEMWQVMQTVADLAKKFFNSWEEYGLSFAFGRGVWQGDTDDYESAYEVVFTLLVEDESPWKQIKW